MTFAIAHDDTADRSLSAALVWRTCLRDVAFAPDPAELRRADHALVDRDAYALLLEILCGLRSPLLGETEVLGQFKAFLSSVDRDHDWLHRLGRQLLTDAREVRATHLLGLGSRTYGSAVRRHLSGAAHVALVGTGTLGRELLPFLASDGRTLDVWGRRAACPIPDLPASAYRPVSDASRRGAVLLPTVLVVAAPAPAAIVSTVAARYDHLLAIVDLRGEPGREPFVFGPPVVTLEEVFAEMQAASARAEAQVALATKEIARRSTAFASRVDLRPFGWDDLCA